MSIKPLPPDVAAQIKSSVTITSLNDAICGLAKNSLDAKATKITIFVDYSRGNCTVEDNGEGILPAEFSESGGLGKPHCTSRFPPLPGVHGRAGTFLSSLAALSLLSVTSHHHGHYSQNTIKIHKSDVIARHTPSLPDQKRLASRYGTRVTVRDLFGSMPVRVKQRAISAEKGLHSRELDRLRHILASLVLPWPDLITISVHDSSRQQGISIRNNGAVLQDAPDRGNRSLLISRVARVLYTAGLSEEVSPESWVPLKASASGIQVSGAVCLVPVATKRMQFISIGVQPVLSELNSSILHDEINKIFSNSSFGDQEDAILTDTERDKKAKDRRFKTDGYTSRELKARRGVDRWPMLYMMINFGDLANPVQDVEGLLSEGRQGLETTIDIVRAVIVEFLRRYHFRPTRIKPPQTNLAGSSQSGKARVSPEKTDRGQSSSTASKTSHAINDDTEVGTQPTTGDLAVAQLHLPTVKGSSESVFSRFTGFKSGRQDTALPGPSDTKDLEIRPRSQPSIRAEHHLSLHHQGICFAPPFLNPEVGDGMSFADKPVISQPQQHSSEAALGNMDDDFVWTNPVTKQKSAVDSRTGFVLRSDEHPEVRNAVRTKTLRLLTSKPVQPHQSDMDDKANTWVSELLSHWRNPVFEAPEAPIPASSTYFGLPKSTQDARPGIFHVSQSKQDSMLAGLASVEGRVSKGALKEAKVISQVDQKFIFAKVPLKSEPSTGLADNEDTYSLLVLIDQHAADERCRVEALMQDYFVSEVSEALERPIARTELLDQSLHFEITTQERTLFERYAPFGEHWGIIYDISPTTSILSTGHSRHRPYLKVTRLPSAIVERCRTEPRLLIDLLRKEIWHYAEHDNGWLALPALQASQRDEGPDQGLHWLARFHRCPQGILDMINSRACRSAIMFNDVLSLGDCEDLLERLADCAMPFQCAHGRPSMVPLVDLGRRISQMDEKGSDGSFGKHFNRWKAGKQ
ncbi:hypothetical protein PG999_002297 [Apiospora kogelbergensis]|uniref:MutL C-terminal dimerisation domain-containing protein n=1 Tax=Apiospora kogelbergensis TaxID=1337665 RepID=A0AAW0R7S0_9PEZI